MRLADINMDFLPSADDNDSESSQHRLLESPEGEAISLASTEGGSSELSDEVTAVQANALYVVTTSRNAEEEMQRYLASFAKPSAEENPYVLKEVQTIFPMDSRYNLCLGNRLGQGFYGDVYKGQ